MSDVEYFPLAENTNYWTLGIGNLKWSVNGFFKDFNIQSSYLIFDTGLDITRIPQTDFNSILTTLRNEFGIECKDSDGDNEFKCDCTAKQYDSLGDMHLQVSTGNGQYETVTIKKEVFMEHSVFSKNKLFLQP